MSFTLCCHLLYAVLHLYYTWLCYIYEMWDGPRRKNIILFWINYGLRSLKYWIFNWSLSPLSVITLQLHNTVTGGKQIKGLLLSICLADRLDDMNELEYVFAWLFLFVLLVFLSHETMSLLLILRTFHIRILTLSPQVCTSCSSVFPLGVFKISSLIVHS